MDLSGLASARHEGPELSLIKLAGWLDGLAWCFSKPASQPEALKITQPASLEMLKSLVDWPAWWLGRYIFSGG
jgi:hypothetical protein